MEEIAEAEAFPATLFEEVQSPKKWLKRKKGINRIPWKKGKKEGDGRAAGEVNSGIRLPTSIGNSVRFNWPHVTGESQQFIHTVGP